MFIKPKQGFKIPVPGRKFFLSEDGEICPEYILEAFIA